MSKGVHEMSIGELLEDRTAEIPDKTYLYFENEEISYRDFNIRANKVGNSLLDIGLKKGDRLGVLLPNVPEILYSFFGAAKIGLIVVPINTGFVAAPEELKYVINNSGLEVVITYKDFFKSVQDILKDCPAIKKIICVEIQDVPEIEPFSKLLEGSPDSPAIKVSKEDLVANMYSSGTTGRPKGVLQAQETFIKSGEWWNNGLKITSEDRCMAMFPFFHANSLVYETFGTLVARASLIMIPIFSASKFWGQVRRYKATQCNSAGSIVAMLYTQPPSDNDADNTLRVMFSGINSGFERDFEKRFGVTIVGGFGLTEVPACTLINIDRVHEREDIPPDKKGEFIGWEQSGMKMKVCDDDGNEVPSNVIGELAVWHPGTVMKGYWKDPKRTAETLKDGWLFTGDNGYRDDKGRFFFVDRKKDMIKRSGENIASAEVERVLNEHPKVQETAVIGVPDPFAGEEVKAYVILNPGVEATPEELIDWCMNKLAYFKLPRYIEFRDSFPRPVAIPKVLKIELRAEKSDLTEGSFDMKAYIKEKRKRG